MCCGARTEVHQLCMMGCDGMLLLGHSEQFLLRIDRLNSSTVRCVSHDSRTVLIVSAYESATLLIARAYLLPLLRWNWPKLCQSRLPSPRCRSCSSPSRPTPPPPRPLTRAPFSSMAAGARTTSTRGQPARSTQRRFRAQHSTAQQSKGQAGQRAITAIDRSIVRAPAASVRPSDAARRRRRRASADSMRPAPRAAQHDKRTRRHDTRRDKTSNRTTDTTAEAASTTGAAAMRRLLTPPPRSSSLCCPPPFVVCRVQYRPGCCWC